MDIWLKTFSLEVGHAKTSQEPSRWAGCKSGSFPTSESTELEVRRTLCVIPVHPCRQIAFVVFPVGLPTIIIIAIALSLLHAYCCAPPADSIGPPPWFRRSKQASLGNKAQSIVQHFLFSCIPLCPWALDSYIAFSTLSQLSPNSSKQIGEAP